MVDVRAPRKQPAAPEDDGPYRMGFTWGRALAIGAVVTMIIFWIWIFSGAPKRDNPDYLQDREYAEALEDRCQGLRDELAELPNAADLDSQAARAEVLGEQAVARVGVAGRESRPERRIHARVRASGRRAWRHCGAECRGTARGGGEGHRNAPAGAAREEA